MDIGVDIVVGGAHRCLGASHRECDFVFASWLHRAVVGLIGHCLDAREVGIGAIVYCVVPRVGGGAATHIAYHGLDGEVGIGFDLLGHRD